MRIRYGALWLRQVGETTEDIEDHLREWGQVLARCSGEQIAYGLDQCDRYPPNAYEFRDLCRQYRLSAAHRLVPRVENRKSISREERQRYLGYMRRAEACPSRADKAAYLDWINKHRERLGMPEVIDIREAQD